MDQASPPVLDIPTLNIFMGFIKKIINEIFKKLSSIYNL
jgi:hypothetical protein